MSSRSALRASLRGQERSTYARLLDGFHASAGATVEDRWRWLTAAHIVGQSVLRLHLHSHCLMFAFAARQRDWREAVGQLFRLTLVPVGHLFGRLPAGNIGRSTVSAFRPMPLDTETRRLISRARTSAASTTPVDEARRLS